MNLIKCFFKVDSENFVLWTFIFAIIVYIINLVLSVLNLNLNLVYSLCIGIIITILSCLFWSLINYKMFKFDIYFLYWSLFHSFFYFIINNILNKSDFKYSFIYFLFFGLLLNLLTWLTKYKLIPFCILTYSKIKYFINDINKDCWVGLSNEEIPAWLNKYLSNQISNQQINPHSGNTYYVNGKTFTYKIKFICWGHSTSECEPKIYRRLK